jgi:hypothetical protein
MQSGLINRVANPCKYTDTQGFEHVVPSQGARYMQNFLSELIASFSSPTLLRQRVIEERSIGNLY